MKKSEEIPGNQEMQSEGAAWNNGITRRRFLKKTGGATAGVALLSLCDARAQGQCPSGTISKEVEKTWEKELSAGPFLTEPTEAEQISQRDTWDQQHPRSGSPPAGSSHIDTDYDCISVLLTVQTSSYNNNDSIDNTFEAYEGEDGFWYMKATLTIVETISYSAP